LYCGSEDCLVRVYDLVLNKMVKTVQMQGILSFITGYVMDIAFNQEMN
jgi:hypothetical protein